MPYPSALSAYRETRIKTASQGQLIIMLYDEAVKQLDFSLDLLSRGDNGKKDPGKIEKINKAVVKTQEIITELIASLDFDQGGGIAKNLFSLYTWFNKELLEANIGKDLRRISAIRNMIGDLRTTWSEVIAKNPAGFNNSADERPILGVNIAG